MNNVVLIGFMGSGKSTIAALLSQQLKRPMIDSDAFISAQQQCSISEIFATFGESYFRNLEAEFIQQFSKEMGYIIATGGGMPIFHDIAQLGVRLYLKSDFETIYKRICDETTKSNHNARPLFQERQKAEKLYYERVEIYESCCDYVICATQDSQKVAADILDIINQKEVFL